MDYEKQEQMEKLFEIYGDYDYKPELKFDDLENKYNECEQVSAIVFLASKLKNKQEEYFLHGEHDVLYIGSSFEAFKDFTEDEVKIAVAHGISISDYGGGFEMYASM